MARQRWTHALLLGGVLAAACARAGCASDPPGNAHSDGGADATIDKKPAWDAGGSDTTAEVADGGDSGIGNPTDAPALDGATGYEWLFDDAWTPVVTQPGCDVRLGDVSKVQWPGFGWKNCGLGCRRTEVVTGPSYLWKAAYRTGSGSHAGSNGLRIFLAAGVRLPPQAAWAASFEPPSWKLRSIAAIHNDNCTMSFSWNHTGVVQVLGSTAVAALGRATDDGVRFASPTSALGAARLDTTTHWGGIRAQSAVEVSSDFSSTSFKTVHSSAGPLESPRTAGDAVFWIDWGGAFSKLYAWTPAGAARVLVSASYNVSDFAVSLDRVAWIGAQISPQPNPKYSDMRLYWAKLNLDPDKLATVTGPALPLTGPSLATYTAGKWLTTNRAGQAILVVDMDANVVWEILSPPGELRTPIGISDTHLVLAASSPGFQQEAQYFDQLVEYDLAQVASFAKQVP